MRTAAPLGLIAWQLVLIETARAVHRYSDNQRALSNIQLLVPLMASDDVASVESDSSAAGERYERARVEKDMPFSNIPASEFVLDENAPFSEKKKRGHKHSRKQDLANWPRSVYLESEVSEESDERDESGEAGELSTQVWRACRSLTRAAAGRQHEVLLALCAELLDSAPAPPAPPSLPPCSWCAQRALPVWPQPYSRTAGLPARRDLVSLGEDPYQVKKYMRSRLRKRPYHTPDWAMK